MSSESLEIVTNAVEAIKDYRDALFALTLGEIWACIYNPPDKPWKIALLVIVLASRLPGLIERWREWRASRKVVNFAWPAPPVCPPSLCLSCALVSVSDSHTQEAAPEWTGRIIPSPDIYAHERDPSLLADSKAAEHVTCYDPSTGTHIATIPLRTAAGVRDQVAAADSAQPGWAKSSFAQRKSVLRSIKAWILRDMEDIVNVAVRDTGKTRECPTEI